MTPQEIENFDAFVRSLRNYPLWMPEGVQGSDIDCIIHAANRRKPDAFLVLEFKEGSKAGNIGQKILFEGLRKLGMTVVVVHLNENNQTVFLSGDWWGRDIPLEVFTERVRQWWKDNKEPKRAG